jgi:hypothetical protein
MNLRRLRRPATLSALLVLVAALLFPSVQVHGEPTDQRPSNPDKPCDPVRFTTPSTTYYYLAPPLAETEIVCFIPPDTPALHDPIPLANPLAAGIPAASELAAHIHDLFYPQLAARLAQDDLPRHARQKLERYRATRAALQSELLATLASLENASPDARRQGIEALHRRQGPQLHTLEILAGQLRDELGENLSSRLHARISRPPNTPTSPTSLRSAAYFLDGLSSEQRRFLLSLAQESETSGQTRILFLPHGTHLRLPASIPPLLATACEPYQALRHRLRDELLSVFASVGPDDIRDLQERLARLASTQAPLFAELDKLADAVRAQLATLPELTGAPATPELPAPLADRIGAYRHRKQELLRQINATLTQATRDARRQGAQSGSQTASAFPPEQQAELAALNKELNEIRAALAEHQRATGDYQDRKSIHDLLENFERARLAQELREKYRDYRTALLAPDLSPDQRELLLDAALQSLALPLPPGWVLPPP